MIELLLNIKCLAKREVFGVALRGATHGGRAQKSRGGGEGVPPERAAIWIFHLPLIFRGFAVGDVIAAARRHNLWQWRKIWPTFLMSYGKLSGFGGIAIPRMRSL